MILTEHPHFGPDNLPPHLVERFPWTPKYLGFWLHREPVQGLKPGELWHIAGYQDSMRGVRLPWPGDFVDRSWDTHERLLVLDYLLGPHPDHPYRGSAFCRLCGVNLGNREFRDGTYTWPEGFPHYLAQHFVKPSQEFIQHALDQRAAS